MEEHGGNIVSSSKPRPAGSLTHQEWLTIETGNIYTKSDVAADHVIRGLGEVAFDLDKVKTVDARNGLVVFEVGAPFVYKGRQMSRGEAFLVEAKDLNLPTRLFTNEYDDEFLKAEGDKRTKDEVLADYINDELRRFKRGGS